MLNKAKLLRSILAVFFCFNVSIAMAAICPTDPDHPPAGWIPFGSNISLSKNAKQPGGQCPAFSVAAVGMPALNNVVCYYSSNQILIGTNYTQATSQNWAPATCLKHPQVQGSQYTTCCDQSIDSCTFN
jgi:hypothetical protein